VSAFSRLTGDSSSKTKSGQNYYSIVKPPVAPAPVAFMVVWTILFLLYGMGGVAMLYPCLMCEKPTQETVTKLWMAGTLYVIVLALLYAWMPVFANR
jgi:tryptophan-rich sensory protein